MTNVDAHPMSDYTLVSLFCGAGGLDLGFENAGFKTIWANDNNPDACATHRGWSDAEVICDDIKNIAVSSIPKSTIIAGGFPCQGFSLAGPRKLDDSRNVLYRFFVDAVEANEPPVFVAENVKGLLTLGNGEIASAIFGDFASKGYDVYPTLVNAADYGVPQDRMRVILVGVRKDLKRKFVFPEPFEKKVTLRTALRNFPEPDPMDVCDAPYSSRYMSRNRRRDWNQQSFTIPAMAKQCPLHPSSPSMTKLSPDNWQFGEGKTRRFSWREAAAVQTFPKNLNFEGNLTSKYLQIGNAVPVALAEVAARSIREQILE